VNQPPAEIPGGPEWFDVVDECDRVIDRQPRSEVHRRRLRHRAIHVFVFDPAGRLLIHLRSPHKEEFPDVWTSSCSGHVGSGESYDESARRELLEELGVTAELECLHKFDAREDTSWEFTTLYRAVCDGEIVPDPREITGTCWRPVDDIDRDARTNPQKFSPAFRLLFGWYLENLHGR
jgi:isopentenyl-diphosphate delta-isomerase type 1